MVYKSIDTLIRNNKVEEALKFLESHVSTLPEIFQTTFSIQYSDYTKYRSESFSGIDDVKDLNKLKKRVLEFSRSIDLYNETGEVPEPVKEKHTTSQISNSKNFNTGTINANGDVNIGGN